jgi:hypothetical protein
MEQKTETNAGDGDQASLKKVANGRIHRGAETTFKNGRNRKSKRVGQLKRLL